MPRRFTDIPDHLREPHEIEVRGFWNVYFIAIGVVILLGLLTGLHLDRVASARAHVSGCRRDRS